MAVFKTKKCSTYGWSKEGCPCARCYPLALRPAGRAPWRNPPVTFWAFWISTVWIAFWQFRPWGIPVGASFAVGIDLLTILGLWGSTLRQRGRFAVARPALGTLAGPARDRKRLPGPSHEPGAPVGRPVAFSTKKVLYRK